MISGSAGDDRLYGNPGDDRLFGQAGRDLVSGAVGDDALYGGTGSGTSREREHLDGGADRTGRGDFCSAGPLTVRVGCER